MAIQKLRGLEDILADSFGEEQDLFAEETPKVSPIEMVETPMETPSYTNLENIQVDNMGNQSNLATSNQQRNNLQSMLEQNTTTGGGYSPPMSNVVPKGPSIVPPTPTPVPKFKPGENPFAGLGQAPFGPPGGGAQGGGKGGGGKAPVGDGGK